MFTVCALFYGDHPKLAGRLLDSLSRGLAYNAVTDVRIGLNACSQATRSLVHEWANRPTAMETITTFEERTGRNVGKYPLMRRMVLAKPVTAPYVMWFDDDSYVADRERGGFLHKVHEAMEHARAAMIGEVWKLRPPGFRGNQRAAIKAQPWFTGKPIDPPHVPSFCTGGWWAIRSEILAKWDYPFKELHHNGGDSILGELCRQQGHAICDVRKLKDKLVEVNRAERRGITSRWVWEDYHPHAAADLTHQDFETLITEYGRSRWTSKCTGFRPPTSSPGASSPS